MFSPALVPLAAGRSRFYKIAVQHSEMPMGFVRLMSFTGQTLSREKHLAAAVISNLNLWLHTYLCSYTRLNEKLGFSQAWISQVSVSW